MTSISASRSIANIVEISTLELQSSSCDFTTIEHDRDQETVYSQAFCAQMTLAFSGLQGWHGACIAED